MRKNRGKRLESRAEVDPDAPCIALPTVARVVCVIGMGEVEGVARPSTPLAEDIGLIPMLALDGCSELTLGEVMEDSDGNEDKGQVGTGDALGERRGVCAWALICRRSAGDRIGVRECCAITSVVVDWAWDRGGKGKGDEAGGDAEGESSSSSRSGASIGMRICVWGCMGGLDAWDKI